MLYSNKRNSIEPTDLRSVLPIVTNRRRSSKKSKSIICQEKCSLSTDELMALEKRLYLKIEETQQIITHILARLEIKEPEI